MERDRERQRETYKTRRLCAYGSGNLAPINPKALARSGRAVVEYTGSRFLVLPPRSMYLRAGTHAK